MYNISKYCIAPPAPVDPNPELTIALRNVDVYMTPNCEITILHSSILDKYKHIKIYLLPMIHLKPNTGKDQTIQGVKYSYIRWCIFTIEYLHSRHPELQKYDHDAVFGKCKSTGLMIPMCDKEVIAGGNRNCICCERYVEYDECPAKAYYNKVCKLEDDLHNSAVLQKIMK